MVATSRIDALVTPLVHGKSPGCAVAVMQSGDVIHSRGYGLLDLEHGVPITPATVFHAASLSKQFTAFAVLALAADGRLSLDDDVRKHAPDAVPDFGARITLRHLLHHTSGFRDQWRLLRLAGRRWMDEKTTDDVLLRPGALNDGTPVGYGAGVGIAVHRGLRIVRHSGWDLGYLRFDRV